MNFITTNEASRLWNITARRVAMLAAQGRIPGAKYIENRWFIPSDSEKPSDIRTKSKKTLSQRRYKFPNIVYTICSDHPVEELDAEEKSLYDAIMRYESGDFEEGIAVAAELLKSTKRLYIQIGALYILSFLYIITRRFEEANSAIFRCFDACAKAEDHKNEISLLMHELELVIRNKDWYEKEFSLTPCSEYSDFELSYFCYLSVFQDILTAVSDKSKANINTHEIALRRLEKDGYSFLSMYCHFYISLLYGGRGDEEAERFHLNRSFEIATENNTYTSLAGFACFLPDMPLAILKDYPAEISDKFASLMELNSSTYADFFAYSGGKNLLSRLSCKDYILISYCLRKYTLEKIAALENISVSKTKKLYVALYKKLGVKGKKELIEAYSSALSSPFR